MTRAERDLNACQQELKRLSAETQAIWKKADEEDRSSTDEERQQAEKNLRAMDDLQAQKARLEETIATENRVRELGTEIGTREPETKSLGTDMAVREERKTIGQLFVESEGFKNLQQAVKEGGTFSEVIRMDSHQKAGTLLSGTLSPGSGQGGGLLAVPQVDTGVVETLFDAIRVQDVLPTGQASGNTIRYVVEGTATNSAAAVAEAGAKPASDLALSTVDEQVKKIATILTVSDEMLEDAAQVESYINRRLSLFVRIEEEDEIITGGGANEITGFLSRSGINTYAAGTVDNNAVALFKAINGTRGSSFLEPDYIVMHPDNWQATRLLTDTAGQFFGGGPFQGPYGSGQNLPASGQVTGALDAIWGKPVIVSSRIGSGTALLGAFRTASMLWRRSGITVEATNSHASYFANNLVALRAESRLALAVYRAGAFTKVTGLD
jgi:HK97 family phage major capsid protein